MASWNPPSVITCRIIIATLAIFLSGCASMISSTTARFADSLAVGILNQDDLQTVADGAPAYLILIDGLIDGNPERVSLMMAGARLYGLYGSIFVDDPTRAQQMTTKAFRYASRGMCAMHKSGCGLEKMVYADFVARLAEFNREHIDVLYVYATSWAAWIQAHSKDWNAIADLAKVKAALKHVIKLNPNYDQGGAHLYLGVLSALIPPAMGGKPDEAKAHFEYAISASKGQNLMAKTYYAERYARMMFDRPLHDRLLREVLDAETHIHRLTLINTLAQKKARILLNSADEYF